jgi:hypothetical protein
MNEQSQRQLEADRLKREEAGETVIKKGNNITLNPLGAVLRLGLLEYTRGFGDVVSVGVSGLYLAPLVLVFDLGYAF